MGKIILQQYEYSKTSHHLYTLDYWNITIVQKIEFIHVLGLVHLKHSRLLSDSRFRVFIQCIQSIQSVSEYLTMAQHRLCISYTIFKSTVAWYYSSFMFMLFVLKPDVIRSCFRFFWCRRSWVIKNRSTEDGDHARERWDAYSGEKKRSFQQIRRALAFLCCYTYCMYQRL